MRILTWRYWREKLINFLDDKINPHEYLFVSSAHGSRLRFFISDYSLFERQVRERKCLLTKRQAERELSDWISYACSVGGNGDVVNVVDYIEQNNNWREVFPIITFEKPHEQVA